jgi:hypothetical protein
MTFKVADQWRHGNAKPVFDYMEEDSDLGRAFKDACWSTFNITGLGDMYPMADKWGIHSYRYIPYGLKAAMRETGWEDFTGRVFGKTRNSKRLQAAVANTDPYIVAYARDFRGLVPNDELVSFVENTHFDDEMMDGFEGEDPKVRNLLLAMNEKSRRVILARGLDLSDIRNINNRISKNLVHHYIKLDKDYDSWTDALGLRPW